VLFAVPVVIVPTCKVPSICPLPEPDIAPATVNPNTGGLLVFIPTLPLAWNEAITVEVAEFGSFRSI
jgi:hypothetical protein